MSEQEQRQRQRQEQDGGEFDVNVIKQQMRMFRWERDAGSLGE